MILRLLVQVFLFFIKYNYYKFYNMFCDQVSVTTSQNLRYSIVEGDRGIGGK